MAVGGLGSGGVSLVGVTRRTFTANGRRPSFGTNSAVAITCHVIRNDGRHMRLCHNIIVGVTKRNSGGHFAIHGVSKAMNIRHVFPVRSPTVSDVAIGGINGIHHTGLCCLHTLANGGTEVRRGEIGRWSLSFLRGGKMFSKERCSFFGLRPLCRSFLCGRRRASLG